MEVIFLIGVLIFSVVLHEVSHGLAAYSQGDSTAKDAGRLTLNPIPHIDPVGSILVPLILVLLPVRGLIAWAKPVPVNPLNFRNRKWGEVQVSLAGIAANLALAVTFGLLLRFGMNQEALQAIVPILRDIVLLNIILGIFNMVPIPPLDGSHVLSVFLPPQLAEVRDFFFRYGFFMLLALIFLFPGLFFGLILIPILGLFQLIVGVPVCALPGIFPFCY
ncbi:MAG: site-2 protease family protein [Candidatus Yanofskybacteria bacterium]|nr:site-2 protease family protein [Candidatus Yanofskybacteria bacterium]